MIPKPVKPCLRAAANRSCSRLSCYSPGVFLAVLGAGAIVVATHWHGVVSGLKIAAVAGFATAVGVLGGLAIIAVGNAAAGAFARRSARREAGRLAAVSGAYAAELAASVCKWQRPGSALERAEDDLSDAASRRAMSAPFRWQDEAAAVWSPAWAASQARQDRETGTAPGLGLLGDGRQYGSLEELADAAAGQPLPEPGEQHTGARLTADGRVLLPGGTPCGCEWCGHGAARQAALAADPGAVVGIRFDEDGSEVPVTAGELLNISTGAAFRPLADFARDDGPSPVLERSRQAMASSEELLEAAGRQWRSGEARRTAEASWRHVPAEQAWRHWAASNAAHGHAPAGNQVPATDPITGAPIHYDETP